MGLAFANPIGLAAGFDKNGQYIDALASLGFGFIEVGGVTPLPQSGNAKPRIFRLPEAQAIINRMGLNSQGAEQVCRNIQRSCRRYRSGGGMLGINLGCNATTPAEGVPSDYCTLLTTLSPFADFFTINISSPNTQGLRSWQESNKLNILLEAITSHRATLAKCIPLLIKISPDLSEGDITTIAKAVAAHGIDGVVACNTTTARPASVRAHRHAAQAGGLSGKPLAARATAIIRQLRGLLPPPVVIIGAGGILTPDDAKEKLAAGADLIQIYTGLIYQGPALPRQLLTALQTAG